MDSGVSGSTGKAWYTVVLLMFAYLLAMLDRTILPMMIVPVQRDLHISDTQFGLLQGFAFALFYCFAGIPIGWLVDRRSRRNIIAVGIALWSIMTMLSGAASSFMHLFLARFGVGVGEATLNPAAYSMMADLFPRDRLTRAVSIFTTGAMMGTGIAFLFGAGLLSAFARHPVLELPLVGVVHPWQVSFLVAGAPGLLLAILIFTFREPARSQTPGESATWTALAQFFGRNWLLLCLHFSGFSFLGMALYGFMTWAPALLTRQYGLRPAVIGLSMGTSLSVFGIAGLVAGGALADRWLRLGGADAHMRVGLVGMTSAIPFALMLSLSTSLVVGVIGLCGLFFSLLLPGAAGPAGLQLITPPLLRGRLSALFMMVINLIGLGLGPLCVGVFTDRVFHNPLAVGRSLCLLTIIVMPLAMLVFGRARSPFAARVMAEGQSVLVETGQAA